MRWRGPSQSNRVCGDGPARPRPTAGETCAHIVNARLTKSFEIGVEDRHVKVIRTVAVLVVDRDSTPSELLADIDLGGVCLSWAAARRGSCIPEGAPKIASRPSPCPSCPLAGLSLVRRRHVRAGSSLCHGGACAAASRPPSGFSHGPALSAPVGPQIPSPCMDWSMEDLVHAARRLGAAGRRRRRGPARPRPWCCAAPA